MLAWRVKIRWRRALVCLLVCLLLIAGGVLLVEQNANKALSIADRAYVLGTGKITISGSANDVLADDRVRAAYLGG